MIVDESQIELSIIFHPRKVIDGVVTHVHARVSVLLTEVSEVVF